MIENLGWIAEAHSLLFVPASQPERFPKASSSGADGIILDLEDGVADGDKQSALLNALSWLHPVHKAVIRINGFGTPWQDQELESLRNRGAVTVMLPKVESAEQVRLVREVLGPGSSIIPTIESARGLTNLADICAAPGVVRLGFGNVDLAKDLNVSAINRDALQYPRSAVVVQSRAHELAPPLDGVTLDVKNEEAVTEDALYAASMGFGGRICIHPAQVRATNEAFQPSASQLEWARRVVEMSHDAAVLVVDGQMVDKPVVDRARRMLDSARRRNVS